MNRLNLDLNHLCTLKIQSMCIYATGSINALTLLIQPSNDVVYIVGEEPSAVQDGGQHGCDGSTGHRLIV